MESSRNQEENDLQMFLLNSEVLISPNIGEFDVNHLNSEVRKYIQKIVGHYEQMKIEVSPVAIKLILKDDILVHQGPRRVSYSDKLFIEKQIQEWLNETIIQRIFSECAIRFVLVSTKDGSKRLCCDYRKLNEKMLREFLHVS